MRGRRLFVWGSCALAGFACARTPDPTATLCAQVLARREPDARVVAATASALDAELRFELGGDWRSEPEQGRIECVFEEGERGNLRLRSARLDGAALTRAELAVVNADLWLADLRRAGRGAPHPLDPEAGQPRD